MDELALFAGAGGGILGGKLLGWKTVGAVEIEDYPRKVLMQRQDDGILDPFPIWDDVTTFDGKPWAGLVDIVSGGFPCQDISAAGKGAGIEGERSGLWSEMSRIIGEVRPRFVFVENSPMLTSRGLGTVLGDLAALWYDAEWGVVGAHHAGAPHKRNRIWIVADNSKHGRREGRARRSDSGSERECEPERTFQALANASSGRYRNQECQIPTGRDAAINGGIDVSDTTQREQIGRRDRAGRRTGSAVKSELEPGIGQWWKSEPDVGRVAHGVASRVDRLRALGNGQVPAVAALAWRILTGGNDDR